ncbi:MAG TPA: hypothetical protein DDW41_03795 [Candidatus Andersenbacteria bacterium]|nr:MAG: hypothetical protein A3B76_02250 [Candidatus Andersenbacteria bacterium RIFCSPHIGHO2_02_FULL_46_16]OGY37569.1 MAG: hypothetical protein A3I08_04165 [Candidatus Andersenbacteria bacterium RIFCSPLOWO2_02_FULL_46_11]HBE90304.1 hypothetical protein [Candidatus Andersenbacteria bacterium]
MDYVYFSSLLQVRMEKTLGDDSDLRVVFPRAYAKYTLKEGTLEERRELLGCLKSKLYLDGQTLVIK